MHQRRTIRLSNPVVRFTSAALLAVTLATSAIVLSANPLCVLYTPDNPEYWFFFCWYER
jgi:hypothetical protein